MSALSCWHSILTSVTAATWCGLQLQTPGDTQRQEVCSQVAAVGAVSPVTSRGRGSLPYHLLSGRGFVFTPGMGFALLFHSLGSLRACVDSAVISLFF